MKSKLHRELHQLLVQERISLESGIVNYITYQLAEIEVTESQLLQGFSFEDRWRSAEEKEKITFAIPEKFSLAQIKKLMHSLGLSEENYQHEKPLLLDDRYIFAEFLPKFTHYFKMLKESSPEIIAKYRILSAPILESTAKNTLCKFIEETRKILLSDSLKELTATRKSLVDFILLLSGRMSALDRFPLFYKDILKSVDNINEFLQLQEIKDDKELSALLKMMLEGMELYARYHRNESVLANIALYKELKEFLAPYSISPEKNCDILEHMVLALAGAEMLSQSRCRFAKGYDAARLIITFGDIDQENTDKVIHYLRHQPIGDETACEGNGSRRYGSALRRSNSGQECARLQRSDEEDDDDVAATRQPEVRTIEVDGKLFYDKVFPKIKEKIQQMAAENLLDSYKELSKEHFKAKEAAKVSTMSLFSKSSAAADRATQEFAPAVDMSL